MMINRWPPHIPHLPHRKITIYGWSTSPAEFEEFTLYLLRTFGFELTRVGGSGDEGIDRTGSSLRLSCGPASCGYRDARLSASGWARR